MGPKYTVVSIFSPKGQLFAQANGMDWYLNVFHYRTRRRNYFTTEPEDVIITMLAPTKYFCVKFPFVVEG